MATALVRATAEGLYIRNVLRLLWREVSIGLESDSTAAIGTAKATIMMWKKSVRRA